MARSYYIFANEHTEKKFNIVTGYVNDDVPKIFVCQYGLLYSDIKLPFVHGIVIGMLY